VQEQLQQLERQQKRTGERVRRAVGQRGLPAGVARSGNERVQLAVCGQIGRTVLFTDDGDRGGPSSSMTTPAARRSA